MVVLVNQMAYIPSGTRDFVVDMLNNFCVMQAQVKKRLVTLDVLDWL